MKRLSLVLVIAAAAVVAAGSGRAVAQGVSITSLPRGVTQGAALQVPALARQANRKRSDVRSLLKLMAVDGATKQTEVGWESTGAGWVLAGREPKGFARRALD